MFRRLVPALTFALLVASPLAAEYGYVSPSYSSTAGGAVIYITSQQAIGCNSLTCAPPDVFFDGIPSLLVTVLGEKQVKAVAPPHPAEAVVNIRITRPGVSVTLDGGQFAYIADRERIVVPLDVAGLRGFGGSSWSTELWVHNGNAVDVALLPKICGGFEPLHECEGDRLIVPAGSSRRLPSNSADYSPHYLARLYSVVRDAAAQVTFDLRLRDTNHPDTSATSIPVVRGDSERSKFVLLNVPVSSGSRTLLRVYTPLFGGSWQFPVHVYDLESGTRLADQLLNGVAAVRRRWRVDRVDVGDLRAPRGASRRTGTRGGGGDAAVDAAPLGHGHGDGQRHAARHGHHAVAVRLYPFERPFPTFWHDPTQARARRDRHRAFSSRGTRRRMDAHARLPHVRQDAVPRAAAVVGGRAGAG